MPNIKEGVGLPPEDPTFTSIEARNTVLSQLHREIFFNPDGLSAERFEEVKNKLVAPGESVEDLVKRLISGFEGKWIGEGEDRRFVPDYSKVEIDFKPEEEEIIRKSVCSSGRPVGNVLKELILAGIAWGTVPKRDR